ncbi:hypothetical protein A1O7_08947 [Cladophialophora yegresii CBS 114405]|uniref:DUF4211 domain-containing protein n=1 Tax=Cladophialophora yegresii CBS 114405 TaxID=1182544 RepID=W9VV24_9EURO|nr:uncharacterized protein A1O7_08947 [Cladophialophora yegresii CBS 114405]EXJ56016.1 hypothetical protein A1O7_08947 [Cladophialophora yegresii CBS 114405]
MRLASDSDEDDLVTPAQKRRKVSNALPVVQTPTSMPSRRSTRLHQGSSSPLRSRTLIADEDVSDELQSSPPRRSSGRLRRGLSARTARTTISESSHGHASPPVLSSANRQPTLSDIGSPESSDDDVVMVTKPAPRRKSRVDMDDPFVVNDDQLTASADEEHPRTKTPKKGKPRGDVFVVSDDEVEYVSSEDESEDDGVHPAVRSRPHSSMPKSSSKRRRRTRQEQDELDEDLQDLQDSGQQIPHTEARRTRGGPVTTERDKTREHFDLLKRRRAGAKITRIADSDDDESDETAEAADIDLIGEPHDDLADEQSDTSVIDLDVHDREVEHDVDEDDFIEYDNEGRHGRPHQDIPLQFTSFASKKPKELFIHIIEWMVKNKIAPAFNREDPVYNLAFSRVDDQVRAQAGSRLISSAWGNEFKHTILARPYMRVVALPGEDEDHMRTCDACNRTNNPARYEFVFSGEPYYRKTLEPVDDSDDEEGEKEEEDEARADKNDNITYDDAGHSIASSNTRFFLGRFCAANAEMGHKLTHWKYHLNESLMAYLESQGVLSAEAIVAREKMNKKKREKEAENIVDSMEETGVIDTFWKEFENDLNDARLGMEDFEKRGGRTKGRAGAIRAKSGRLVREWDKDRVKVAVALDSDSEGE